jgi:GH18 family chitinase
MLFTTGLKFLVSLIFNDFFCYFRDWSIWGGQEQFYPNMIAGDQLTHLNFAFLDFDADGNLVFTDSDAAVGATFES